MIVGVLLFCAIFATPVAPHGFKTQNHGSLFEAPNSRFLLGTDNFGRDTLSRIVFGARISMYIAVLGIGISSVFGMLLGLVSGYFGGKLDLFTQRVVDMFMGFPTLVLAIVIVAMRGASLNNVVFAVAMVAWPQTVRIVRSGVLGIKEQPFVDAAKAIGASDARIMFRHIMPNALAAFVILVTVQLAFAILIEASLSFLGLGPPPPDPSWGRMLSVARQHLHKSPWMAIFPGLALSLAVFAFNLIGDALRDYWDPRLRK